MCLFRPPSLIKLNFFETLKRIGYFKPIFDNYQYYSSIDDFPMDIVIHQLEQVNIDNPTDWLVKYLLGDWYIRAKEYSKAVTLLEQALTLRPEDIRSTYALATAYRILTRARLIGIPKEELTDSPIHILGIDFDPETSNKELNKHGITLDDSAFKAMELFEETLRLGVRSNEKVIVSESLQKMYSDFPHLEVKVKNQRKSKYLGDARKGSGGVFNEAMSHYSRLRFLLDAPPRYRFELAEVIRLSLWAIATDNHDGDSYILLANAYSLLDSCVSFTAKDPEYYLRWSAAIIHHWATTPLRQYPFSKNAKIGDQLYKSILLHFQLSHHFSGDVADSFMDNLVETYLISALSPANYEKIKAQLEAEPV